VSATINLTDYSDGRMIVLVVDKIVQAKTGTPHGSGSAPTEITLVGADVIAVMEPLHKVQSRIEEANTNA